MAARQCIECMKDISSRQQGLQCDGCSKWQHRTCNSGVSQDAYRQAIRLGTPLCWTCASCQPIAEASAMLQDLSVRPAKSTIKKRVAKFGQLTTSKKTSDSIATAAPEPLPTAKTIKKRLAKMPQRTATIPSSSVQCSSLITDTLDSLDLPRISLPQPIIEEEVVYPAIDPQSDCTPDPDYQIIPDSSQRGRDKLVDCGGFTYVKARVGKTVTAWRCTVRSTYAICAATVRQTGDTFTRGPQPHNHPGQPGAASTARIQSAVKKEAKAAIFEPALNIVESAILKETEEHGLRPNLPKPTNLTRCANYTRKKLRPAEPKDLDFEYGNR